MARYKLRIKKSAAKELEAIPSKADHRRIVARIETLADNPRPTGCKKLSASERYRIVYAIKDKQLVVYVVKIGDRKNVYRTLQPAHAVRACGAGPACGRLLMQVVMFPLWSTKAIRANLHLWSFPQQIYLS